MEEAQVRKAVLALQKFHSSREEKKRKLIEENPMISLIIGLKKIPNKTVRPHRISLPHSLYPPDETELCLFSRTDKKTTKELLARKGVKDTFKKVIPLDKLKTDYKTYDSKKQLSCYYDVYLADRRIYHLLPRHLGKSFFVKKRFPFPVNIQKEDLSREISLARDSTYLHLGLGSCVSVPIGRINYPSPHIVENIMKGMRGVIARIPRGWSNIQAVNLKTIDSIAIPVYHSLPPEAKLLGPQLDERPPQKKRVKLMSVGDDEEEEERKEMVVEEERKEEVVEEEGGAKLAEEEEKERGRGGGGGVASSPPQPAHKKMMRRGMTKLARKKVRGSTILSSHYDKSRTSTTRRRQPRGKSS